MNDPAQLIAVGRVSAAPRSNELRTPVLDGLRRRVAEMERLPPILKDGGPSIGWTLGAPQIDERLSRQGLTINATHEIAAAGYADTASAMGFALSLAIRRLRMMQHQASPILWCRLSHANAEWGRLYGHGLVAMGLPREQLLIVSLRKPQALLWTIEEAVRSGTLAAVIADIDARTFDLTISRRLSLAAEKGSTPGLLVFSHPVNGGTAALTRWQVKAQPSTAPPFDAHAPGLPAWTLMLERCRGGRPGEWIVEWSHATHRFSLVAPISGRTAEPHFEAGRPYAVEPSRSGLRAR